MRTQRLLPPSAFLRRLKPGAPLCAAVVLGACALDGAHEQRGEVAERQSSLTLAGSCEGFCGGRSIDGCWCDDLCTGYGDCCADYVPICEPACNGSSPLSSDERVKGMARGPSGEMYVAGTLHGSPLDASDGFLRRIDPATHATLWTQVIDNCHWDTVEDLAVSPKGDVLVVGSTRGGPFGTTETDFFVRRYSPSGSMLWQATSNTKAVGETGLAIAVDAADDSAVVTGAVTTPSEMNALFARVDRTGVLSAIDSLSFSSKEFDVGRAIAVHPDRRISLLSSVSQARLVRLTAAGSVVWMADLESGAARTEAKDLALGDSGEIFALTVGVTTSSSTTQVPNVFRYKANGSRIWRREIVLNSRRWHPAHALIREASGSILVAGEYSVGLGPRPWVQRITSSGATAITRTLTAPQVYQVRGLALLSSTRALLAASPSPSGSTLVFDVSL